MKVVDKSCLHSSYKNGDEYELPSQMLHNLMSFKIREILLVSSLYDAFIIEEEGLISEMVVGEYQDLLLSSPPRVTRAASGRKALEKIGSHGYDLVITMSKNIGMDPFTFGRKMKQACPGMPVIILATDSADLHVCQDRIHEKGIDRAFFWNGDTRLVLAIVKYVEDKLNVGYDTITADVRTIIVLEDSIRYYSMFLPIIYTEIVKQIQRSLSEDLNEMQRLLRRRARPKILLADSYEEGIELYNKYKENMLGIISDVKFYKDGKLDPKAGHDFIKYVKNDNKNLPTVLQSSDSKNRRRAEDLNSYFIYKNSLTLLQDFDDFLINHLGFGDFVFLKPLKSKKETIEIARASNMEEFEKIMQKIPADSIRYHADRNDFSNWLMCRGEFKLASFLRPKKATDFADLDENRDYLIEIFKETRRERQLRAMADFSQQTFEFNNSFTKISGGSLGGKARGIAFIRSLVSRYGLNEKYMELDITVPSIAVIGTEEFDEFLKENNIREKLQNLGRLSDKEISNIFLKADLPKNLNKKLRKILANFKKPLAIRSSSLLEDSQHHPFAGVYSTYLIPNNHKKLSEKLDQLSHAIKLVYASVFFSASDEYIKSTASKIEEEKMAIIIQELVGRNHNGRFYPTFSGTIQSYNYYPIPPQKREDGIVNLAVGLGHSVVGGEKVLRFSPKYPENIPELSPPKMAFQNTQNNLYVLDISKSKKHHLSENDVTNLSRIKISDILEDGELQYVASSYDMNDDRIIDDFSEKGPQIITFSSLIKYGKIPFVKIFENILKIGKQGMGCHVEIEFAVDMHSAPPTFALLQIRPMVLSLESSEINWPKGEKNPENILLSSKRSLGRGSIENISDIVLVKKETFSSTKTLEIAREIEQINKQMAKEDKEYVLIGPGRWGTQDRFLGIPVRWSQISNVKILVEVALKNFNIRPTQGTHFLQNMISRGVGYINIPLNSEDCLIDWKWIKEQKIQKELNFVKHVRLPVPLTIKLDGRSGRALIMKPKS
ncbi:MAG: PEP/pyruvate-binding domain-containing protein [Candidatus Thermoplasmatota archaeon]|nr:PEP/pyruvate-binding domain-containing protein [Candidatus Thermoplasmatota archaeon]